MLLGTQVPYNNYSQFIHINLMAHIWMEILGT